MSLIDGDQLRRRIGGWAPPPPAARSPMGRGRTEPDRAAAIGALAQLHVWQTIEADAGQFAERPRPRDQNPAVRDRVICIAPKPRINQKAADDKVNPCKNERHTP